MNLKRKMAVGATGFVLVLFFTPFFANAQGTGESCLEWTVTDPGGNKTPGVSDEEVARNYMGTGFTRECTKVAGIDLSPLGNVGGNSTGKVGEEGDDLIQYIIKFYKFGMGISGLLALVMIVRGGLLVTISGAVDKKKEGMDMIKSALWGVALLFGAHLILRTINPRLVELKVPILDNVSFPQIVCVEGSVEKEAGGAPLCAQNITPELVNRGGGSGKQCTCLSPDSSRNYCTLGTVKNIESLGACVPRKVWLFADGGGDLSQFLTSYYYLEKEAGGTLKKTMFYKKIKPDSGDLKHGVVAYRAPFYRSKGSGGTGPATTECLVFYYKILNEDGTSKKVDRLETVNSNEAWTPCVWDDGEVKNFIRDTYKKGGVNAFKGLENFIDPDAFDITIGTNALNAPEKDESAVLTGASCNERKAFVDVASGGTMSHKQAVEILKDAGIGISSTGNCADICRGSCTSLGGIQPYTIHGLKFMKGDCKNVMGGRDCDIVVSGGTEIGHSATGEHRPGGRAIDIRFVNDANAQLINGYLDQRSGGGKRAISIEFVMSNGNSSKAGYKITKICSPAGYVSLNCGNFVEKTPHFHLEFSKE